MSLLQNTLLSLIKESQNSRIRHIAQHISHYESWEQLNILKQILCMRSPYPFLPADTTRDIDEILTQSKDQRVLVSGASIPSVATLARPRNHDIHIKLWQGDITSLASDVNAITNAANSQMLGCFQPSHKCIDNVIHSVAGPRLRQECFEIMEARAKDLPVGEAVVTRGYCLPSPHVIHTVGPQLAQGAMPTDEERQQLRQCYVSVLEQAEGLPNCEDGSKRVALCGISTGLFAFPTETAAQIAVDTVLAWFTHNETTSITEVIFVTFAEGDFDIYSHLFKQVVGPWQLTPRSSTPEFQIEGNTLDIARNWLDSADTIIISAGAGLSAADGLDYTSKALFRKHFSAFLPLGLTTLYSAIGFNDWPSDEDKWAYYFSNVQMVRSWPSWSLYQHLIPWLKASGKDVHIRTSNADGLFLANGWSEEQLSTPQGRYSVLQCLSKCRPESTFDTAPYFEAALPFLDPQTQKLTDPSKVPRCPNCGGDMMICVRGGSWFNEKPFEAGERRWKNFRRNVLQDGRQTVILELGAGMNTPGVLRWPNEDLVRRGGGKVKLVRVGLGESTMVPEDLEANRNAVGIDGDIKIALPHIFKRLDVS